MFITLKINITNIFINNRSFTQTLIRYFKDKQAQSIEPTQTYRLSNIRGADIL